MRKTDLTISSLRAFRGASVLLICSLYFLYDDLIFGNQWSSPLFMIGFSFYFLSSIFISIYSIFALKFISCDVMLRCLGQRIFRTSSALVVGLICLRYLVNDSFSEIVMEMSTQVLRLLSSGETVNLMHPSPPLYLVMWLIFMDFVLYVLLVMVSPVVRLAMYYAHLTRLRGRIYIAFSCLLLVFLWYKFLYYPTNKYFDTDDFPPFIAAGRLIYRLIRWREWVFALVVASLSLLSSYQRHSRPESRYDSDTYFLSFCALFSIYIVLLPLFDYTMGTSYSRWSWTPAFVPFSCLLPHLLVKATDYSKPQSIHSDSPSPSQAIERENSTINDVFESAFTPYIHQILSNPFSSALIQSNFEMLCMFPASWAMAAWILPETTGFCQLLLSCPFHISAAMLVRMYVSESLCRFMGINIEAVEANSVFNHSQDTEKIKYMSLSKVEV